MTTHLANITVDVKVLFHGHNSDGVRRAFDGGDTFTTGRTFWRENSEKNVTADSYYTDLHRRRLSYWSDELTINKTIKTVMSREILS